MAEISIGSVANQIIKEYQELAGHTMTPSVSEYIEARKQAILEIGTGIYNKEPVQTNNSKNIQQATPTTEITPKKEAKQPERKAGYEHKEPYTKTPSVPKADKTEKKKEEKPVNTTTIAEKTQTRSDFEILRGLKDEWN